MESVRKLRAWEKDQPDHGTEYNCRQYILGASACENEATKQDTIDVGMDMFMLKPLVIPELLDKLNELYTPFERLL